MNKILCFKADKVYRTDNCIFIVIYMNIIKHQNPLCLKMHSFLLFIFIKKLKQK